MPRRADLDLRQGLADRAEERVLDQSLPGLFPQGAVHVGEQTFDRAQLPRRRPSGDARARRRRPEMDEVEALRRRAPLRDDEMDDGTPTLPGAGVEKSRKRVGVGDPRLQHQANHPNPRPEPPDRGPESPPGVSLGRPFARRAQRITPKSAPHHIQRKTKLEFSRPGKAGTTEAPLFDDRYLGHAITRKSLGLMTRKLSVTESRNISQHLGTLSRTNHSTAWAKVG